MNKKKLSVAALAIALSVGTVSSATANQGQGTIDGSHVGTTRLNLIASTLGMDVATLQTKLRVGASLASLAGDKTGVLITALVALESQEIDAAVAAGKLTATQASEKKANLAAEETREVNATGHVSMGGASFGEMNFKGSFGTNHHKGHGERNNFLRSSR